MCLNAARILTAYCRGSRVNVTLLEPVKEFMKTRWGKKFGRLLLLTGLAGAGIGLVGCADEYAAYPGYRGGYYASYAAAPYPYYGGYGYGYPYRAYGPYYGSSFYGGAYPYYGTGAVVISSGHGYTTYRDRSGRVYRRRTVNTVRNSNRATRQTTRTTRTTRTRVNPAYQNDDERRYYPAR
jgi:hypothetical protein